MHITDDFSIELLIQPGSLVDNGSYKPIQMGPQDENSRTKGSPVFDNLRVHPLHSIATGI